MSTPFQVLTWIDRMSGVRLDTLPFGVIQLDTDGTVLQFNLHQAMLSNRRASETIGRDFFRDVAPCADVHEFHGRFRRGIEDGRLHVAFDHRFDFFPMPLEARVTLYYSSHSGTVWVFVQEKAPATLTAASLSGSSALQ